MARTARPARSGAAPPPARRPDATGRGWLSARRAAGTLSLPAAACRSRAGTARARCARAGARHPTARVNSRCSKPVQPRRCASSHPQSQHAAARPGEARYRGTEQYDLEHRERKRQRGRLRDDGAPARELARRNALQRRVRRCATEPRSARSRPRASASSVDLPAPLGPTTATTPSRRAASRSMSSTSRRPLTA